MAVAMPTATMPTMSEIRAPNSMREKTSLPRPSVPIKCCADGDSKDSLDVDGIRIIGAISGAIIARM